MVRLSLMLVILIIILFIGAMFGLVIITWRSEEKLARNLMAQKGQLITDQTEIDKLFENLKEEIDNLTRQMGRWKPLSAATATGNRNLLSLRVIGNAGRFNVVFILVVKDGETEYFSSEKRFEKDLSLNLFSW